MLSDLKPNSGLDLKLDNQKYQLIFSTGLTQLQPAIRSIAEMREVLLDAGIQSPKDLYYMYRDVHLLKDAQLLKENKLRYDVTVIRPERLGQELMKTAGHYHPGSFGELYEVVAGRALCLLQKYHPDDYRIIEDVILVEAYAGQKIVIPPGYGHILINPGPDCLVTSNWVSSQFSSEYDLYKKAKGAAYFLVNAGAGNKIEFIKNKFFQKVSAIRFAQPVEELAAFGLKENSPMYAIITKDAGKLDFLNHPDRYDYSGVFKFLDPEQIKLTVSA